jgi:hypothetical protein
MLNTALNIVVNGLNTYIGQVDPEVIMGNVSLVDAYQDTSAQSLTDKVVVSIINIEQEGTLRNVPFRQTITGPDGLPLGVERQPEVYLNVFVLFGANKSNYSTALQRISQVISFFQKKFVFVQADTPELIPLNIDRLIFDLYSTSFDELNQVWSINGGKYIPSVIYKMRMAMIQDAEQQETGIIEEVDLQTGRLDAINTQN